MRLLVVFGIVAALTSLGGCVSTAMAPSIYVDNGIGSEFGNNGLQAAGQTVSPSGDRCIVFNQDRPLSKDFALRVVTESCGSASKMECKEVSRTIIPIAQSKAV